MIPEDGSASSEEEGLGLLGVARVEGAEVDTDKISVRSSGNRTKINK